MAEHAPDTADDRRLLTGRQLAVIATMSHAPLLLAWFVVPFAFQFGQLLAMPLVYLLGGLTLFCAAVAFTSMARRVRHPGGLYALVANGLGPAVGLGVAAVVLISYFGMLTSLYAVFGGTLSGLLATAFGVRLPGAVAVLLGVAVVAALHAAPLRWATRLLGGLLIAQLALLVWFDVRVLRLPMDSDALVAPLHPGWLFGGSFGVALCFAVTAFIGLDTSLNFHRDVRNPARSVPRAAYVACAVMTGASALSAWAIGAASGFQPQGGPGAAGPSLPALIAFIVGPGWAETVSRLIVLVLVLAAAGTALVLHKAVDRQLSGLAADGVLPAALRLDAPGRWRVHLAVSVSAAIGGLLVVHGKDSVYALWLGLASGLGITGALSLTSAAVLAWFLRTDEEEAGVVGWEGRAVAGAVAAVVTGFVFVFGLSRLTSVFPPAAGRPSWLLPTLIGAAFVGGLLRAAFLRAARPAAYASIGRVPRDDIRYRVNSRARVARR